MEEELNQGEEEEEESSDDDILLLSDLEDDKTYKEELKIVESIIQKFLIGSESSFLVDVNILLILKALPKKVHNLNLAQTNLFTFSILQNSMIAFQNQDQVNAFEFFDEFNRNRVQNIRTCILQQKDNLNLVLNIMNEVKEMVQENEEKLIDCEEMAQKADMKNEENSKKREHYQT